MKKHNHPTSNSEARAEQVTCKAAETILPEAILLGLDLHKANILLTRIIDHATPQPGQKFTWDSMMAFVEKQLKLAKKVYAVYEAGAFGFWLARKLKAMGVECYVIHPEKLDPHHKRVQTDKTDSRHLVDKLQRYVLGNQQAMTPVYIPTEQEENQRIESRHRDALRKQLNSLKRRGASLLLSQGIFQTHGWWRTAAWAKLQGRISPQLQAALAEIRLLIEPLAALAKGVEKKLEAAAPKELPRGFGRLTYVLMSREICNYQRFHSRRNLGGFTGLGGAVASSGPYHVDLSITKVGSPYLRKTLIELAWRMIFWQPNYTGLRVWKRLCGGGGGPVHARRRKVAVVAVARQLAVDIWKWQTGRVTAAELGWEMATTA